VSVTGQEASGGNRRGQEQWPMTVTAVTDLLPRLRRLTFTAEEFGRYVPAGPDECFGLLAPGQGRTHLRWYTVRAHRPEAAEIDVDVVLHEHAGPAVRWSAAAVVGSTIDFRRSGASYAPPEPCAARLLLADETALPALAAIVEALPSPAGVRAVVELPDVSWTYEVGGEVAVEWRHRSGSTPGSCLVDAVARDPYPLDYAWVCGEAGGVKAVRRTLIDRWDLDRRRITFSGYWRAG
jgi:NADPH-dependent ferric siderophore reductase